jgi:aspartate aminotransferase
MTGWRIGYAAGPVALIKAMAQDAIAVDLEPLFDQPICRARGADRAAGLPEGLSREAFQRRRDLVVSMLNACQGITCPVPEGAFYVYPDIAGLHRQDQRRRHRDHR